MVEYDQLCAEPVTLADDGPAGYAELVTLTADGQGRIYARGWRGSAGYGSPIMPLPLSLVPVAQHGVPDAPPMRVQTTDRPQASSFDDTARKRVLSFMSARIIALTAFEKSRRLLIDHRASTRPAHERRRSWHRSAFPEVPERPARAADIAPDYRECRRRQPRQSRRRSDRALAPIRQAAWASVFPLSSELEGLVPGCRYGHSPPNASNSARIAGP